MAPAQVLTVGIVSRDSHLEVPRVCSCGFLNNTTASSFSTSTSRSISTDLEAFIYPPPSPHTPDIFPIIFPSSHLISSHASPIPPLYLESNSLTELLQPHTLPSTFSHSLPLSPSLPLNQTPLGHPYPKIPPNTNHGPRPPQKSPRAGEAHLQRPRHRHCRFSRRAMDRGQYRPMGQPARRALCRPDGRQCHTPRVLGRGLQGEGAKRYAPLSFRLPSSHSPSPSTSPFPFPSQTQAPQKAL